MIYLGQVFQVISSKVFCYYDYVINYVIPILTFNVINLSVWFQLQKKR